MFANAGSSSHPIATPSCYRYMVLLGVKNENSIPFVAVSINSINVVLVRIVVCGNCSNNASALMRIASFNGILVNKLLASNDTM